MNVHLLCDCVHVCCFWHHINFHAHTDMVSLCSELHDLKDKDTEKQIWICFSSINGTWFLFLHCVCNKLIWWSWRWICERNYLLLHFNGFSTSHFIKGIVLEDCANCSSQTDLKNQKKTSSVQHLLNSYLMQQMLMKRWEEVFIGISVYESCGEVTDIHLGGNLFEFTCGGYGLPCWHV